ncbi:MAG: serine/threonine-protein kinase [Planctomycetota bacterium]|nr:MAG: serine/threonine-protein kinase [Planctomycetota bacterium]
MAVVYRARDLRHDRDVALKVLAPELSAAVGSERFLREIRIAASLQHANIVALYDSGEADGRLYYAMPFLEGETLQKRIQREGPLPLADALAIAREVAEALDYAHAQGIVHRDIKPGNILFLNGRAMLADFGLATAFAGGDEQKLTQSGVMLGTPAYMSPEQATGNGADSKSDIYSLGCVIYEMFAGDPPFAGTNVQAMLARHVSDPAPPIRSVRPSLPRGVDATLSKALAKVPADRFQSAAQMVAALSDERTPTASRTLRLVGAGALAVAVALWFIQPWAPSGKLSPGPTARMTSRGGPEYSGSMSPDSEYLAYSHTRRGTMDIYVQALPAGAMVPLTEGEGDELLPRWSRDGKQIAYVRGNGRDCDVYTISFAERVPTMLIETHIPPIHSFWDAMQALGTSPWSPADERLLFSRRLETGELAIFQVELQSRELRQLTAPTPGAHDLAASFSEDGEWIAFTRSHGGVQEIWLLPAAGGAERRLLSQGPFSDHEPGFLLDDEYLVFTSDRGGMDNLWGVHIATGQLSQLTFGGGKDWYPNVAADGRVIYSRWSHQTDLYRVNVATGESIQVTDYTQDNFVGRYAPTGDRIAYQSTRTGKSELWIVDPVTGDELLNLTKNPEFLDVLPAWSPNGEEIAFLSDRAGSLNIWVANSDGTGRPEQLSDEEIHIPSKVWAVSLSLRWTPDGQSIGYIVADAQGPSLWTIDRVGPTNTQSLYPSVLRFDWYFDRHRIVYTTLSAEGMELRAANLETQADVLLWAGPHSEMILAPDGMAVAFVLSASHFNQSLYLLELEPPNAADGLPRSRGEPRLITGGQGLWHVHNGSWSPDGEWIVYTRDVDDGDIYSLTLEED